MTMMTMNCRRWTRCLGNWEAKHSYHYALLSSHSRHCSYVILHTLPRDNGFYTSQKKRRIRIFTLPPGQWFLHISKEATNSNLYPPTGRVGRGSGRGGATGFHGNSVVDRPFALPARSSRPSRRESEERCVETNALREGRVFHSSRC